MSKLSNLSSEVAVIQEQIRKTAQEKVVPAIRETLTEMQTVIPSLTKVRWAQCTPYFNDGEECTFRVEEATFQFSDASVKGSYVSTDDDTGSYYDSWSLSKTLNPAQYEVLKKFGKDLYGIQELLKDAFGDHAQITVTSDGIETESYDHE
jgi:hypothetical protein